MKRFIPLIFLAFIAGLSSTSLSADDKSVAAAKAQRFPQLPENVERRAVTIWSDGTGDPNGIRIHWKRLSKNDKIALESYIHLASQPTEVSAPTSQISAVFDSQFAMQRYAQFQQDRWLITTSLQSA